MIIIAITLGLVALCYLIDYILAKKVKEANDCADSIKIMKTTIEQVDRLMGKEYMKNIRKGYDING